jgi:Putative addiction module component.
MNSQSVQLNVPLDFNQLISLVKQLSPREKLKLESLIWSETDEKDIEISTTHKQIVFERLQKMNANSAECKSWEDIERNLNL